VNHKLLLLFLIGFNEHVQAYDDGCAHHGNTDHDTAGDKFNVHFSSFFFDLDFLYLASRVSISALDTDMTLLARASKRSNSVSSDDVSGFIKNHEFSATFFKAIK
jgi:hypothetical protein